MATEKRLVDANAVYEMGHRTPFHIGIADLCDLKELLADVPTVDAVEVVRCKDCKKWFAEEPERCKKLCASPYGWCTRTRSIYEVEYTDITQHDDFCSHGERKTE